MSNIIMYYTYNTDRLSLKILNTDAAEQVLEFYLENKELEAFEATRSEQFYTREYQRLALEYEFDQACAGRMFRFWIYEKCNKEKIIGTVSVRNILRAPYTKCEIGYKIHKDFRRRGYARESLAFVRDLVFDDVKLHRIEATTLIDNTASIKLLESLGFVREGYLHNYIEVAGAYRDHLLFAATMLLDTADL